MRETPRTDAEATRIREDMLIFVLDELGCMAEFARTLERELNAKTAQIEEAVLFMASHYPAHSDLLNACKTAIGERENYLKALRLVLASACPHPMENGQMHHAWGEARKVLPQNTKALPTPAENSTTH